MKREEIGLIKEVKKYKNFKSENFIFFEKKDKSFLYLNFSIGYIRIECNGKLKNIIPKILKLIIKEY